MPYTPGSPQANSELAYRADELRKAAAESIPNANAQPRVQGEKFTTWESFQIDGKRYFIVPAEDVTVTPAPSIPTLPAADGSPTYPPLQPVTEPAKP